MLVITVVIDSDYYCLTFVISGDTIENGSGTAAPVMPAEVSVADSSIMSYSSLYGFCSVSKSLSARCRNAVSNPNKAVVTIDSVNAEVII